MCLAGYVGDGTVCRSNLMNHFFTPPPPILFHYDYPLFLRLKSSEPISSSPNFMTFPSLVLSGSEILTVDFPANFTTSIEPVAGTTTMNRFSPHLPLLLSSSPSFPLSQLSVCTPFYDVNSTTTCRVAVFVQLQRRTLQLVNLGNVLSPLSHFSHSLSFY